MIDSNGDISAAQEPSCTHVKELTAGKDFWLFMIFHLPLLVCHGTIQEGVLEVWSGVRVFG